ncbi:hypothetical protein [Nocardia salmonicida]|uniref:hypothetical protein n=1 Tax=Nocardia salmonicida TaxID=53431 RepID=UPI0007A3D8F5|nr:hypothetical protein [Nocardia salmonicida]MBC7299826.1 hypothetical protein [Nocardia sp.]
MTAILSTTSPLSPAFHIHFSQIAATSPDDWTLMAATLRRVATAARASLLCGTGTSPKVAQMAAEISDQLDRVADQLDR